MRNPLRKRLPRLLRQDGKKYIVLFLLLSITIGFISGMFLASDSSLLAASAIITDNELEDGHFELEKQATDTLKESFEEEGITLYDQFYKDFPEGQENGKNEEASAGSQQETVIRIFVNREQVNLSSILYGRLPERTGEIAIDRMHADNVGIKLEDTLYVGETPLRVVGLIALSDYSTLFKDNSDIMFDALTFDIGVVSREQFDALDAGITWQYAFRYNERPADQNEEKEKSDDLMVQLAVLSATGGLYDDEDEAKAFADEAEEIKGYGDVLKEAEKISDIIKPQQEELEELQKQAEEKGKELEQELIDTLTEKGQSLQDYLEQEEIKQVLDQAQEILDQDIDFDYWEEAADAVDRNGNKLVDYVPNYANSAIHFTTEDMSHDKVMAEYLLLILVVVLAFIFAITTSNMITADAAVIGTLRASGYTRGEMLRHYAALPILVTLFSALVGNLLGYTLFKEVVVAMYYNSYSLPLYETKWNADAFVQTTLWPVLIVTTINLLTIYRKMRIDPLKFMRRDLSVSKRKRAIRLPKWKFFTRFRTRIFLSNVTSYLVLILGIGFSMILLVFMVGMPATLRNYENKAADMLLAKYQYVLKSWQDEDDHPITTAQESAEPFDMCILNTIDGVRVDEEIYTYGYFRSDGFFQGVPEDMSGMDCYISQPYAEKFYLQVGDTITLKEPYGNQTYTFTVKGIHPHQANPAVFLTNRQYEEIFDTEEGAYTGFFSEEEITDIDPEQIAVVYTREDITKVTDQLQHSIGSLMDYFSYVCGLLALLLIYLLTKIIIEKNAGSISMVKVLGYTNKEISALYIRLTTIVVIVGTCLVTYGAMAFIRWIWRLFMNSYPGWFVFYMSAGDVVRCILIVIAAYLIVSFIDTRRIRRIPMTDALKNVE